MSYLPRITHLDISRYEMYPGANSGEGVDRAIEPGITLVVGANGLGKTTLVDLLRHMCAGPARLTNRSRGAFEAGGLDATSVNVETFADRVGDRAVNASARIVMEVGQTSFEVTRALRNLALTTLVVDGLEEDPTEERFQTCVVAAAEVASYPDWLLLIDYLVFVTEDRSEPFWDRNVQRHLLRVLTQDAQASGAVSEAESQHISADSEFRNARVQLNRHKVRFEKLAAQVEGSDDISDELIKLSRESSTVEAAIAQLEADLQDARDRHREAVREYELSEVERGLVIDSLEAARFALIEAAIPSQDDVIRYLTARLATSDVCPVCGQEGGDIAANLASTTCFLCGLEVATEPPEAHADVVELETEVQRAQAAVDANAARMTDRAEHLRATEASLASERTQRAELEGRMRALRAQLPEGDTDVGGQAALISDLEADLESLRRELDGSRAQLAALIETSNEAVMARQENIKSVFDRVATMFLVERCHLVPHQAPIRIGQEGGRFDIQSFDLDLGSATELGESRRDTGDDVSESQRVFIDIAFRIALVETCVASGSGTMVVDAPEGSLDAVFSTNAADLLFAFVSPENDDRHLVVATNLIEGTMLPRLAELGGVRAATDSRLINLLELAAPTAAVVERRDEYRAVLQRALEGTSSNGGAP